MDVIRALNCKRMAATAWAPAYLFARMRTIAELADPNEAAGFTAVGALHAFRWRRASSPGGQLA